jgi:hypothetical protein
MLIAVQCGAPLGPTRVIKHIYAVAAGFGGSQRNHLGKCTFSGVPAYVLVWPHTLAGGLDPQLLLA